MQHLMFSFIIVLVVQLVTSQRLTISGTECEFPLVVDGVEYSDCILFDNVDYCQTSTGVWSECAGPVEEQETPFSILSAFANLGKSPAPAPTPTQPVLAPASEISTVDNQPSQITVTPLLIPEEEEPAIVIPEPVTPTRQVGVEAVGGELPGITGIEIDLSAANAAREVDVKSADNSGTSVRINEVVVGRGSDQPDWVELINLSGEVINVAGWKLIDLNSSIALKPQGYELGLGECADIPGLYDIQPGSYLKLSSKAQCSFPFGLGENDGIQLLGVDDTIVDFFSWRQSDLTPGTSFVRLPDGADAPIYLGKPTPASANEPATGLDFLKSSCCAALAGVGFTSQLPVMIIDTRQRDIPNEPKIDGVFMCTCSGEGEVEDDYSGYVGIEIRGHTSARDYAKKSFSMELRDVNNADLDFPLLGLPKEEDFVLYGPEEDRSLGLKNIMAYQLSQALGQYASRYRIIEVFLVTDGVPLNPSHYHGIYILGEKPKRGKNRIDISERIGADFTGGYIMKHDNNNYDEGDYWFNTTLKQIEIIIVYPKPEFLMEQEARYIMDYVDKVESALEGKSFKNLQSGYPAFINVDSFVDYMLVVEATKNPDGYRGSCYMHKDRGGLLNMGPVWDYNEAFGTCCGYPFEGYTEEGISDGVSGGSAISVEGWRFNICEDAERCQIDPKDGVSLWYRRMWEDPAFQKRVVSRWQEARQAAISDAFVEALIEEFRNQAQAAAMRNYERWGAVIGEEWFDTYDIQWTYYVDRLKDWLLAHMQWIDSELTKYE